MKPEDIVLKICPHCKIPFTDVVKWHSYNISTHVSACLTRGKTKKQKELTKSSKFVKSIGSFFKCTNGKFQCFFIYYH